MPIQTRAPTSDEAVLGTWSGSAGTRWQLVDDHPDNAGTDVVTCTALSGGSARLTFNFSAFSVPAGSIINSVLVRYYDRKGGAQGAQSAASLKVGDVYTSATTHNPINGTLVLRVDTWTTNPNTGSAWTVDQVNGVAATNNLQAFGFFTGDTTPNVTWASVEIEVDYTGLPATGTISSTLDNVTSNTQIIVRNTGTISSVLSGVTASFSGSLPTTNAGFISLLNFSGGWIPESTGTFASNLDSFTGSFAGTVSTGGTIAVTLDNVTMDFSGSATGGGPQAGYRSLLWLEGSGAGAVITTTGTFASTLSGVTSGLTGAVSNQGTFASTLGDVTSTASLFVGQSFAGFQSLLWYYGSGAGAVPPEPFRLQPYEDGVPYSWYADPGYASTYVFESLGISVGRRDSSGAISGEINATLGNDTSAFAGNVIQSVTGSFAATLEDFISDATITVGSPEGTFDSTLQGLLSFNFQGFVTVTGPLDSILSFTSTFSGTVAPNITGNFVSTLDNIISDTNIVVRYDATGTIGVTLEGVSASMFGFHGDPALFRITPRWISIPISISLS